MAGICTFVDKKCIIPNCDTVIRWDRYNFHNGICDAHREKYMGKRYCPKCRKICQDYDATGIPDDCQHMPDLRCVMCKTKSMNFLEILPQLLQYGSMTSNVGSHCPCVCMDR